MSCFIIWLGGKLELCWVCSSAVQLNLSLLYWLLLIKACVKILHLFRLILFETLKKQGEIVMFLRSVFLSLMCLLQKKWKDTYIYIYVYGHVIYIWVLPSSLMGLRSGLHPSKLTNTLPLPQILWSFPLVTQLPHHLNREQFPRGWACCLCNSYLPPPEGTLYC